MTFYIVIFFFSLLGLLAGLYHGFVSLQKQGESDGPKPDKTIDGKPAPPAPKTPDQSQAIGKIKSKIKGSGKQKENKLSQRLQTQDISFSEFNCAAEGIDYAAYLQQKQQQEETAYHILQDTDNFVHL